MRLLKFVNKSRMKIYLLSIASLLLLSSVSVSAISAPKVYVPLGDKNEIVVIDAESSTVIARIPEVINPHGLAITPDQRYLVAGAYTEIDPTQGGSPPKPSGVSEEEHQKHHKVVSAESNLPVNTSFVSMVEVRTNQVVHRIEVRGAVHHTAVTTDSRYAIATHPTAGGVSVIDLQSRRVLKVISTGPLPNYAVFTKDGKQAYVSNAGNNTITEISTLDWTVTRTLATGIAPEHVILSSDGTKLYVNNVGDGTVSVIVLDEGSIGQVYNVGAVPHGIDISDDGRILFVASKGDNKLVAIDLVDSTQRTIPLEPAPYHVTSVNGTGVLYVSSRSLEKIWVVDQKSLQTVGEIALGGIGHQMVVSTR